LNSKEVAQFCYSARLTILLTFTVVPMQWEKWLAFILFSFTFFTLAKPTKDVRDVLLDSWRKGVKRKQ